MNTDNEPVNLKPYLKNGIRHKLATLLYGLVFQPISDMLNRMSEKRTAKKVAAALRNIPE